MCGIPTAVVMLLAPAAGPLRARYPRLTVHIREVEQQAGYDLLFDGSVDLAVLGSTPDNPPAGDPRVDQRPLVGDVFDLVVPDGHALAGQRRARLAEVAGEDWILPPAHVRGVRGGRLAHLVAHGLGVALVPRLALAGGAPSRKLLTCTRAGARDHPAIAATLAELATVAA